MGAYAAVELYNLMSGGHITGTGIFSPSALQSSYMDGLLRVDLPDFASAYMVILVLFYSSSPGYFPYGFVRAQDGVETDSRHLPFALSSHFLLPLSFH